jgi:hypothetical protein
MCGGMQPLSCTKIAWSASARACCAGPPVTTSGFGTSRDWVKWVCTNSNKVILFSQPSFFHSGHEQHASRPSPWVAVSALSHSQASSSGSLSGVDSAHSLCYCRGRQVAGGWHVDCPEPQHLHLWKDGGTACARDLCSCGHEGRRSCAAGFLEWRHSVSILRGRVPCGSPGFLKTRKQTCALLVTERPHVGRSCRSMTSAVGCGPTVLLNGTA